VPEAAPAPAPALDPRLRVRGLRVLLPGGRALIDDLSLEVAAGQVAVILGGSGAGKSTFSRVLFEPDSLAEDGFEVDAAGVTFDRGDLGLVPQRGALFDHLDVRGNLELALRYGRGREDDEEALRWLDRVGLDRRLGDDGVPVSSLSGGQAQRVAVARALAGGRRLLFLDEPSVGLDPHRVRMLARLVREQADRQGVAVIVVTHDVALAAGCGDRLYVLDAASRRLEELFPGDWTGPLERPGVGDDDRGRWLVRIEAEMIARIERAEQAPPAPAPAGAGARLVDAGRGAVRALGGFTRPFAVAATALRFLPGQLVRHPGDFARVGGRVLVQAVVRPALFYLFVSALIGYTVLYVISKIGGPGFGADAGIRLVGGSYIIALAPVLSAVLYVAASGNAVNAWLGSMGLTRQVLAMEALGVDTRAYLVAPAWFALGLGYLLCAVLFGAGMLLGGMALCRQHGVPGAWTLLSADVLDPRPERVAWAVRAGFLCWCYAWGMASDIVAKGAAQKRQADDVTLGMTRSVVACTLWVVAFELVTAVVVFAR
jgi:ABC-type nitrate/sulfonate/bicarbonate transport system ATPase subunit/ABC-type transporter Mla maintaining outer membrane lipid asymmetry permease subunit MlaE